MSGIDSGVDNGDTNAGSIKAVSVRAACDADLIGTGRSRQVTERSDFTVQRNIRDIASGCDHERGVSWKSDGANLKVVELAHISSTRIFQRRVECRIPSALGLNNDPYLFRAISARDFLSNLARSFVVKRIRELLQKGLDAGVSFAARGNLILIAPPLVIEEQELLDALTLLDRLIGEMESGLTQRLAKSSIRPASASVEAES